MKKAGCDFDFRGFGLAIKEARKKKGWTQARLAEEVGISPRTMTNIESQEQTAGFETFAQIVALLDIPVDRFFHVGGQDGDSRRKHIDILLNSLDEKELAMIEASVEALKQAKES